MNVSRRTIERRLGSLEKRGFIKRLEAAAPKEGKPLVRKFQLKGLIDKLEVAALTGLAQRQFVKRQGQKQLTD